MGPLPGSIGAGGCCGLRFGCGPGAQAREVGPLIGLGVGCISTLSYMVPFPHLLVVDAALQHPMFGDVTFDQKVQLMRLELIVSQFLADSCYSR